MPSQTLIDLQQKLWRSSWQFKACLSHNACYEEQKRLDACNKHAKKNAKELCKDYREKTKICGSEVSSALFAATQSR